MHYTIDMFLEVNIIDNIKNSVYILKHMSMDNFILSLIEIGIIAFCIYNILKWIMNTRAWTLLKGILVLFIFAIVAYACNFEVILFIFGKIALVASIAFVVIFQNDLRLGLEHLGRQNILYRFFTSYRKKNIRSLENVFREIASAAFSMSKVKTGALIVIECDESLEEIVRTGINIDGKVSRQLLINIFEKNTPLHDGAVIVSGDIIKAATCYLPLTSNMQVSKSLGTRHRAALGISEVSDSITIVVSEETGEVSICKNGTITIIENEKALFDYLNKIFRNTDVNTDTKYFDILKGIVRNEK